LVETLPPTRPGAVAESWSLQEEELAVDRGHRELMRLDVAHHRQSDELALSGENARLVGGDQAAGAAFALTSVDENLQLARRSLAEYLRHDFLLLECRIAVAVAITPIDEMHVANDGFPVASRDLHLGLAFAAQAPRDDAYVDDVVLPERLADLVAEKAQFQLIDLDRRFEPLAEAHHTIDLFVVANLERRLDGRAQIRQTLGLVADDPLPQCVKRHPKLIPDCHLRPLGANGSISSLRC